MPVLDAQQLQKAFGDRIVLRDVRLTIRSGERLGLVGNNGSGKSTLARVLAGLEEPDGGTLALRRGARVAYLEQEPILPEAASIRDVVSGALESWSRARDRHEALTTQLAAGVGPEMERLVADQAAAAETVERLGGWERHHEAESMLTSLGLPDPNRTVSTLSGGERRRVALARLLLAAPDLAILDEPTNHLDVGTIEWLERTLLQSLPGALLLITHDRTLLDRTTESTLELHDGALERYAGGYAAYLEGRAERAAHAERVERNRQNFLRRELEWLRRGPKARATKQKARVARATDALGRSAPRREATADLRTDAQRQGKRVLELRGLVIERDGRSLVQKLDLRVAPGERIGIVGPNGSGKTSLLACLLGDLAPAGGEIELGHNTRIGYLDQARNDLDGAETVREAVGGERDHLEIAGESLRVGAYLERFLFDGEAQRKKVGVLSGGERARVALARLLADRANLLLLDEPTNDLDVSTLAALEQMLVDYAGSALIVSHDRWFLDRVATSILSFEGDGTVDLHRGGYTEYREKRDVERAREATRRPAAPAPRPKADRVRPRPPARLSYKEERELEGLIDRIAEVEAEVESLERRLADPALYREDGARVAELTREVEQRRAEVATLTGRWEDLEARKSGLAPESPEAEAPAANGREP